MQIMQAMAAIGIVNLEACESCAFSVLGVHCCGPAGTPMIRHVEVQVPDAQH